MNSIEEMNKELKENGITVEYLQLPVTRLAFDYLIRFTSPVEGVLSREIMSITACPLEGVQLTDVFLQAIRGRFTEMVNGEFEVPEDAKVATIKMKLVRDE